MMEGQKACTGSLCRVWLMVVAALLAASIPGTSSLKIEGMEVPGWVKTGETANLVCKVDLQGDILYSLTWWRGQKQFYQFSPTNLNKKVTYDLPGIVVDESRSNQSVVVLLNVTLQTAGQYRCEVLADFPTFEKDFMEKDLAVVDVPDRVPLIQVGRKTYSRGDMLVANCTSPLVSPLPDIQWMVNGRDVPSQFSRLVSEGYDNPPGLLSPTIELRLPLDEDHFHQGQIQITCISKIEPLYHEASDLTLYTPDRKHVAPSQKLYGTGTVVGANLVMVAVTCVVTVFLLVM